MIRVEAYKMENRKGVNLDLEKQLENVRGTKFEAQRGRYRSDDLSLI